MAREMQHTIDMSIFHGILVPTDFSDDSRRALDYAVELARELAVPVRLAHAHSIPVMPTPDGVMMAPLYNEAEVRTDLEHELDALAEEVRGRGVPDVTTSLLDGATADAIVKAANDGGYDLIVMGTHGRTGLKHLLLGSIAEHVVRQASCPVLTVGPEKSAA